LGVWGVGFGVGGLAHTPQSPIPNPQSPIPNPQNIKKNELNLILIIVYYNKNDVK